MCINLIKHNIYNDLADLYKINCNEDMIHHSSSQSNESVVGQCMLSLVTVEKASWQNDARRALPVSAMAAADQQDVLHSPGYDLLQLQVKHSTQSASQGKSKSKVENLYSGSKRSSLLNRLLQYSLYSLDFMPWLPHMAHWHESPRKVPTYTAWWTEALLCEQLAQGRCPTMPWPGIEPTICRSWVRRPTTTPPSHQAKEVLVNNIFMITRHGSDLKVVFSLRGKYRSIAHSVWLSKPSKALINNSQK